MIAFPVEATTKYLNTFGLISAPSLSQVETTSYKAIVWGIVHLLKMGAWITKQIDTCAYGRKLAAVPLLNGKRQHLKVISRHNLTNKDIFLIPHGFLLLLDIQKQYWEAEKENLALQEHMKVTERIDLLSLISILHYFYKFQCSGEIGWWIG